MGGPHWTRAVLDELVMDALDVQRGLALLAPALPLEVCVVLGAV